MALTMRAYVVVRPCAYFIRQKHFHVKLETFRRSLICKHRLLNRFARVNSLSCRTRIVNIKNTPGNAKYMCIMNVFLFIYFISDTYIFSA